MFGTDVFSLKCRVPVSSTSFQTAENISKGIWNMPQSRQLEKEEKFCIFNVYTINLASNVMVRTWFYFELVCNIGATTKNGTYTASKVRWRHQVNGTFGGKNFRAKCVNRDRRGGF